MGVRSPLPLSPFPMPAPAEVVSIVVSPGASVVLFAAAVVSVLSVALVEADVADGEVVSDISVLSSVGG